MFLMSFHKSYCLCFDHDQYAPEKVQKILVGNKSDEEQKRQVATEQGNKVNSFSLHSQTETVSTFVFQGTKSVMFITCILICSSSLPKLMGWTFLRQVPLPTITLQRYTFVCNRYFLFSFLYLIGLFICTFKQQNAQQGCVRVTLTLCAHFCFVFSCLQLFDLLLPTFSITVFHPIGRISVTSQ